MLEMLEQLISKFSNNIDKYNFLREYFQLLVLKILDEQGFFREITFLGGTALRILYDLERFSEDLDFNVIDSKNFDFTAMLNKIQKELQLMGMDVVIMVKDRPTVAIAHIKFNSILYHFGISQLPDQKLMVKFEVDKNPPLGFTTETSLINKSFLININHLDQSSLFAGKLLAIFCRKYAKGRDYYDLLWFLTRKTKLNLTYLNAGLSQKNFFNTHLALADVKIFLIKKIETLDFSMILKDVSPFLLDFKQARFFEKQVFLSAINAADLD